jgi:hypothetical protein
MDLKKYNELQINIFKKYNLLCNKEFFIICSIISKYKYINNNYYFLKSVLKELKKKGYIKK